MQIASSIAAAGGPGARVVNRTRASSPRLKPIPVWPGRVADFLVLDADGYIFGGELQ